MIEMGTASSELPPAHATFAHTRATVLRVLPYSQTSQIVTWLTQANGKLTTLVKGACRPRSAFLGQYDLYYTCDLVYYARHHDHLHIIRECAALDPRSALRRHWRGAACASYFCDLMLRATQPSAPHAGLHNLLCAALDRAGTSSPTPAFVFWYELRLLARLGLSPRLRECARCGCDTRALASPASFSQESGGVVCARCAATPGRRHAGVPFARDVQSILLGWQDASSPRIAMSTRCTDTQFQAIRGLLGGFLDYHLDVHPAGRDIVLQLLRTPAAGVTRRP